MLLKAIWSGGIAFQCDGNMAAPFASIKRPLCGSVVRCALSITPMQKFLLRPSLMLTAILTVAHGAMIASATVSGMPWWLTAPAVTALAWSCFSAVRQSALLRGPSAIVEIEIAADHRFSIRKRSGGWMACEVLGSTCVVSFLTTINLRTDANRTVRHIVILPDSMDKDDFRRLRVWLRWQWGAEHG